MNLYRISEEVSRLCDMLEQEPMDGSEERREAIALVVDGLREHANDSADRYATAIREMQATAKCRREEAARLRDLADAADNRADRLSRFLVECMDRIGVPRLEGQLFTLRVQRNGGSQPVDVLVAPEELPDRFREVTVTVRPDKDAIRKALEAGDEEARKVACLMERGRSLRIG